MGWNASRHSYRFQRAGGFGGHEGFQGSSAMLLPDHHLASCPRSSAVASTSCLWSEGARSRECLHGGFSALNA